MDCFEKALDEQAGKLEVLEDYSSLYLKKQHMLKELQHLNNKSTDVLVLVHNCFTIVDEKYKSQVKLYKKLKRRIKAYQMTALNIIKALQEKKLIEFKQKNNQPAIAELTPVLPYKIQTPRMYLSDYKESPLISKMRPVVLQFLDFEAQITPAMFEAVPKYIRGRESLDELINFLDQVIVPCFTEKYQLMHKKRSVLRNPTEIELWKLFNLQSKDFPGQKFITQGDISRKINKLVDKKINAKITTLRHLKILQEQRKQSTTYYIWIHSSI